MKKFSWAEYASAAVLSLLIALGAALAPISAFSLPCKTGLLLLPLILACFTLPLLFYPKKQAPIWICFWLFLLAAGYFLRKDLWNALRYTVLELSRKFSQAYTGLAPLDIGKGPLAAPDVTSLFVLLGLLIALCVQWTVLRRQTMLPAAGLSLCCVTLCCLDLSSFSQAGPILLLLSGLILLALTQGTRRSGADAGRLTVLLALPVGAVLGLLFLTNPQAGYVRSAWSDGLEDRVLNALARFPFLTMENGTLEFSTAQFSAYFNTSAVNLRSVGPKFNTGQEVMTVLSGRDGPLYLRGASLGDYTGVSWETLSGQEQENANITNWDAAPLWILEERSVGLRTSSVSGVLYSPYNPSSITYADGETGTQCYDICLKNTDKLWQYTVFYGETGWNPTCAEGDSLQVLQAMSTYQSSSLKDLEEWCGERFSVPSTALRQDTMGDWLRTNREYEAFAQVHYTSLPARTRRGLLSIIHAEGLDQVTGTAQGIPDRAAQAFAVADFVRSSASYDLNTEKMPLGQDFVLWFLKSSDTGYCVHFASATVAMLRAMGIPARYVAGYLVNAERGRWVSVTTDDAHAWAEFYLPGLGWVPLESTPGSASDSFARRLPAASATTPAETEPETEPTETTEATEETTAPTITEEPTAPETVPPQSDPVLTAPSDSRATEPGGFLPGGSTDGTGSSEPGLLQRIWTVVLKILPYVLWPLGILSVLYLRRWAVLSLRRQRLRRADENREAILLYLRLKRLARAAGVPVPRELTDLAQKARFSQHHLARQELQPLYRFQSVVTEKLKKRPRLRRIWDRWILIRY